MYYFSHNSVPSERLHETIRECVQALESVGLNIYGIFSDKGSNFFILAKDLKVTEINLTFS